MTQLKKNSGARTADWLAHQTATGALYAYDLYYNIAAQTEGMAFSKQDFEDALRKVSRRTKPSESDEASSET